jgi:Raf kinase inhibitor-like YbhB/YbcL family protein
MNNKRSIVLGMIFLLLLFSFSCRSAINKHSGSGVSENTAISSDSTDSSDTSSTSSGETSETITQNEGNNMNQGATTTKTDLKLATSAFTFGEKIPKQYTADGKNISPSLSWQEPPKGTKSFVIIVDDPDAPAGVWTHWIVYNIPPDTTSLKEGISRDKKLPDGSLQGKNSGGHIGYDGPAPPKGKTHRYFFNIFALNTVLKAPPGANKKTIESLMERHVIGEGQMMGTYER